MCWAERVLFLYLWFGGDCRVKTEISFRESVERMFDRAVRLIDLPAGLERKNPDL